MPVRRSSYGQQGTRSGVRPRRRRRTSVATRAKYQSPNARNQRAQIRSLARLALKNRRMLTANKVYCDWFDNANTTNTQGLWYGAELTAPINWTAGNRQDASVLTEQVTFCRNMVLEWYASSDQKTQAVVMDVYVVSIRTSAANWFPGNYPTGIWSEGLEYNTMGSGNSVAVNSGLFKVHYNKQFRLYPRTNVDDQGNTFENFSGNPNTVHRNAKVNLKLNMKLRAPASFAWKNLTQANLPPHQRLYLVWRGQSFDQTNQYAFSWGTHITTVGLSG